MSIFNHLGTIFTFLAALAAVGGSIWGILKYYHKYKSKFLLITNCQILHRTLWKDVVMYYQEKGIIPRKYKVDDTQDHAFRPLVLLPLSLKEYTTIKNGDRAELECINVNNENNLKIVAEVYWIPEFKDDPKKPWGAINHPVFSLILRRYFGLERPAYQDEMDPKEMKKMEPHWEIVSHSRVHLDTLHKVDEKDESKVKWAANTNYTHRYFNPTSREYEKVPKDDNFIEYCGFSMVLRKRTWMHIERN